MSDFIDEFFDNSPMIQFRCSGCTQLLEISAAHIGKKMRCPACYRESVVPEKSVEAPSEDMLYGVEQKPSDTRDILLKGQRFLTFPCSTCFTLISVLPNQAGKREVCPECGTKNIVPDLLKKEETLQAAAPQVSPPTVEIYGMETAAPPKIEEETASEESEDAEFPKEFPVHCPMCRTLLYAREEQIDTVLKCPDCDHDVPVRESHRPRKKTKFQPKFYEGGTDFAILEKEKLPPDAKLIPVVCSLCQTLMYATMDQEGLEKECPDCGRMNRIVVPKNQHLLTAAELFPAHSEYMLNDGVVFKRPAPRFNVDYRTVDGSLDNRKPQPTDGKDFVVDPESIRRESPEERRQRRLRKKNQTEDVDIEAFEEDGELKGTRVVWERPQLPDRPFTARFWKFFLFPGLMTRLAVTIILFCLAAPNLVYVIRNDSGIESGGYGNALGVIAYMFRIIFGGLLTLFGTMYLINTALAVFNTTSNGGDEVEDWSEFSLAGGMFLLYYFGVAILAGLLPELCWRLYLSTTGSKQTVPGYISALSGTAAFFLFPILLMFMLESSTMNFFRSGVFRSFFAVPLSWFRFFLLSVPAAAIPGFLFYKTFFADAWNHPNQLAFLLAVTLPVFLLAYFRLMGRLAWIIEDTLTLAVETSEEDNPDGDTDNTDEDFD
ncbi:MAG: hypothetical protein LBQ54_03675 [Planctomycetaceae bacterium]|nr:hypothetical protein [Planctomycetaceae bacterium]